MLAVLIRSRKRFKPSPSWPVFFPEKRELSDQLDEGPNVDEILTIEEIKAQFPSEWVLIGDPQTDESPRLLAGRVLFHSPNRDEIYRKAVELRLPHFAVRYLGTMPENTALVL